MQIIKSANITVNILNKILILMYLEFSALGTKEKLIIR